MLQNFRTYQAALQFYQACKQIKLSSPTRDQLERASLSVLLNLSEGSAKPTAKDRARFYSVSLGSFRECQTLLEITGNSGLVAQHDSLGAMLYRLVYNTKAS